ncbi:MAG: dTDP-4-dehydrorhamnose 3,5-epimerase family protein, partial [Deltaproteobacteria bacterium]|nr:dTDP-4-dehydrorhamnose 3,5-epimerase family protein [Deltaproteobacteria bacterium]
TSEEAQVEYKCTDLYHPEAEFSVAWDDPDLGIAWPIESPVLSEKDQKAPRLCDVQEKLMPYES